MRTILCIIFLLVPFSLTGEVSYGEQNHQFKFSLTPIVGTEKVGFQLIIKNNEDSPLNIEFPTSQFYEITVTDQSGHEVYRYSKGKSFLQALQSIKIGPHQTYLKVENWDYKVNGKRVPAGKYTVTATLLSKKLNGQPLSNEQILVSKIEFNVP